MGHKFAEFAFTPSVRVVQQEHGSRDHYARIDTGADSHQELGPGEQEFIESHDSFYLASVGETGWPYVQHRGGRAGFLRLLDSRTITFADYRGNRQYISVGNLGHDGRVALILVDYPTRTRLKILGRARIVAPTELALLAARVEPKVRVNSERGIVIRIEAFDWNCPQHITPRYAMAQIEELVLPLQERIRELEARTGGTPREASRVRREISTSPDRSSTLVGKPKRRHDPGAG